jgi:hypothetical protein
MGLNEGGKHVRKALRPERWSDLIHSLHARFFGPAAINGDFSSALFGQVVKAAPPRLMQVALKITF